MRPMTVFSGGGLQRHDGEQDVLSVTPIPLRVLNERQIVEARFEDSRPWKRALACYR